MQSRRPSLVTSTAALALTAISIAVYVHWHSASVYTQDTAPRLMNIGIALEAYAVDHAGLYPNIPQAVAPAHSLSIRGYSEAVTLSCWPPTLPVDRFRPFLHRYYPEMPTTDSLGQVLQVGISADRRHYVIRALGTDGHADPELTYAWPRWQAAHDIVYYDSRYLSLVDEWTH